MTASQSALTDRLQKDIEAGLRQADVIGRSLSYLPLYENLNTQKLDTTGLSLEEIIETITPCPSGHGVFAYKLHCIYFLVSLKPRVSYSRRAAVFWLMTLSSMA